MSRWRRRYDRRYVRSGSSTRKLLIIIVAVALIGILAHRKGWISLSPTIISGRAVVLDGDTLSISGTHIRLEGIDAPESEQTCTDAKGETWACGKTAASQLRGRIQGQSVTCNGIDVDKYDRILAVCTLPDGSDVNAWMVRRGWAVSYGFPASTIPSRPLPRARSEACGRGAFTRPSQWRKSAPE